MIALTLGTLTGRLFEGLLLVAAVLCVSRCARRCCASDPSEELD